MPIILMLSFLLFLYPPLSVSLFPSTSHPDDGYYSRLRFYPLSGICHGSNASNASVSIFPLSQICPHSSTRIRNCRSLSFLETLCRTLFFIFLPSDHLKGDFFCGRWSAFLLVVSGRPGWSSPVVPVSQSWIGEQ